tara:strand:- start:503 stop:733 length:231 start_codon:yes stop_codon:yes gene_type:complete
MIFTKINNKGESKMTKEERLNKQVHDQEQTISSLSRRLSDLVDRFMILETDIGYFKRTVASDLKTVNEVLQNQTRR